MYILYQSYNNEYALINCLTKMYVGYYTSIQELLASTEWDPIGKELSLSNAIYTGLRPDLVIRKFDILPTADTYPELFI